MDRAVSGLSNIVAWQIVKYVTAYKHVHHMLSDTYAKTTLAKKRRAQEVTVTIIYIYIYFICPYKMTHVYAYY